MKAEAFFVRVSMPYGREYSKKQNLKKPTTQASKPIPKKKKREMEEVEEVSEHLILEMNTFIIQLLGTSSKGCIYP